MSIAYIWRWCSTPVPSTMHMLCCFLTFCTVCPPSYRGCLSYKTRSLTPSPLHNPYTTLFLSVCMSQRHKECLYKSPRFLKPPPLYNPQAVLLSICLYVHLTLWMSIWLPAGLAPLPLQSIYTGMLYVCQSYRKKGWLPPQSTCSAAIYLSVYPT